MAVILIALRIPNHKIVNFHKKAVHVVSHNSRVQEAALHSSIITAEMLN